MARVIGSLPADSMQAKTGRPERGAPASSYRRFKARQRGVTISALLSTRLIAREAAESSWTYPFALGLGRQCI